MNEPLYMQYLNYMGGLLQGDLGPSFRYAGRTVNDIIWESAPASAQLGIAGLLYAMMLGLASGILAASKPNSMRDYVPMALSLVGVCLPSFVIGPLLVLVFAMTLNWFNVTGWGTPKDMILPAMALGTMYAAYVSRLTRAGVLDIVRQDFIRTAHAKGLPGWKIMIKHALKGGLLPVVSFLGPATAGILVGSFVVETTFNIPGLGRFFVQSALNRDYTLLMGMVLFFAVILLLMNLIVDICYALLDPRVSLQ
jgi:oligopeptide transport system permease protein